MNGTVNIKKNEHLIKIKREKYIVETKTEKKAYPLRQIVNWYWGNYCTRKCFDKEERLRDHSQKLQLFVEKNPNLLMTHRQFLDLFHEQMSICTLDESFKRRSIGWKLFERLQATPNYDSDLMVVEEGWIKRKDGELAKPKYCPACRAAGII